jgi:hypothetical protein
MHPQMRGVVGDALSLVGFHSCFVSIPFCFDQRVLIFLTNIEKCQNEKKMIVINNIQC